ncbi:MAG: RagB/SusD family nutrient uptake outer membrane protein [Candidatus Pseudobacter hemicellulosilyticus]|uniref:RagB/SusD family nutrient uptake outer membrane protein n=1 Tax=Candidatus Pseudobacter hemicellulosilyticus TaxID=3121375 RepID=A0AAJ5WSV1_9BACT|nr:MAG: RagB/SusD family nutrient uptake outer membrane protein [Pseudobacter sp.]
MKILNYTTGIFLSLLVVTAATGCKKDFLDESVYQLTTETAYTTPDQIEMAIGYLHNRMQYMMVGQATAQTFLFSGVGLDAFTFVGDPAFITSDWRQLTSSNAHTELWAANLSQMINYANTVIEACDNETIQFNNDAQRNELKAEAVFFRGWAHRGLAGMFGDWAIITSVIKEQKLNFTRLPRVDVWKQCREDFSFAAKYLPVSTTKPGRIVRAAADHFLAEICISLADHTGDKKLYEEAINAASRVIDGSDGKYSLMTDRFGKRAAESGKNVYWDLFRAGNLNYQEGNLEAIWVVQYDYAKAIAGLGGAPGSQTGNRMLYEQFFQPKWYFNSRTEVNADGAKVYVFGEGAVKFADNASSENGNNYSGYVESGTYCRPTNYMLYDIWVGANTDIRNAEVNIQRKITQAGGELWSDVFARMRAQGNGNKIIAADTIFNTAPRIWKFSSDQHINGDPRLYDADVYMVRMPETYFLRAEAYMKNGNLDLARNDINVVRSRAQAPLIDAGAVTMEYILDERTRELYGEEFRLITLSRLSTKENPVLVNRVKKYGWNFPNLPGESRPNIQSFQWVYPVPQSIINSNSEAAFVQNEGY